MRMLVQKYGLTGSFYMLVCLIRTRLFYRGARIIRFPFDIRNGRHIRFGQGFTTGRNCRLEVCGEDLEEKGICLRIGEQVQINDYVHIAACRQVEIGNHVLIASKVFISDINHGNYKEGEKFDVSLPPEKQALSSAPVKIEAYAWIGESACILPGVTVGEHAVVGALSIVTKSVPPYSIVAGNPARVIKQYNLETQSWERV